MPSTSSAKTLYTDRARIYSRWVSLVRQEQALRALLGSTGLLRDRLRLLDAGCGSGASTFALLGALAQRGYTYASMDAFDLTPAMLEAFRQRLRERGVSHVELREADVLRLDDQLPDSWTNYDLILSTSMLEYLAPNDLERALAGLKNRLAENGNLILVITRKNLLSRLVIDWLWKAHGYSAEEIRAAFSRAGFRRVVFSRFPRSHFWFNSTNHVVIAQP